MSAITTHILDTSRGKPAAGVTVHLEQQTGDGWRPRGTGTTNADGRVEDLLTPDAELEASSYRLTFETAAYFDRHGASSFYPRVRIEFAIHDTDQHYHVPLLLNPFGYSTYRGS